MSILLAAIAVAGPSASFDAKFAWHPTPNQDSAAIAYITISKSVSEEGSVTTLEWKDNSENPVDPVLMHKAKAQRSPDGLLTGLYIETFTVGSDLPQIVLEASRNQRGVLAGTLRTPKKVQNWTLGLPADATVDIDPLEAYLSESRTPERFFIPAFSGGELKNSFVQFNRLGTEWITGPFNGKEGRFQVTLSRSVSDVVQTRTGRSIASGVGASVIRDERGAMVGMEMPQALSVVTRNGQDHGAAQNQLGNLGRNGFLIKL